jgi:hypothetical protein
VETNAAVGSVAPTTQQKYHENWPSFESRAIRIVSNGGPEKHSFRKQIGTIPPHLPFPPIVAIYLSSLNLSAASCRGAGRTLTVAGGLGP